MKSRLKFDVEGLHKGPIEFTFNVPPADFELVGDPEFEFIQDVNGQFTAKFVGGENVVLTGTLTTRARASCVRCLHPLEYPLELKIETIFMPRPERLDEDIDPLEAKKLYYEAGAIHPMERLREEIMLNLPFLPSCELQNGNYCPVRGLAVDGSISFGPSDEEQQDEQPRPPTLPAEAPQPNSWKEQLARVRKKIDTGEGN